MMVYSHNAEPSEKYSSTYPMTQTNVQFQPYDVVSGMEMCGRQQLLFINQTVGTKTSDSFQQVMNFHSLKQKFLEISLR
jgi:hypothetical protein